MITFKRVLLGLFAILALSLLATFLFAKDFSVEISETQAQTLFDKEISSGPFQKYGVKLSVNEATIDFRDDNTMRLDADLTSDALGYKSVIKGQFTSGVRYSVPRIYLNDLKKPVGCFGQCFLEIFVRFAEYVIEMFFGLFVLCVFSLSF